MWIAHLHADIGDAYPAGLGTAGDAVLLQPVPRWARTSITASAASDYGRASTGGPGKRRCAAPRTTILRTSFHLGGFGTRCSWSIGPSSLPLAVTDLRPSEEAQAAEYERFLDAGCDRAFAWEQAPLLRVHLHLL